MNESKPSTHERTNTVKITGRIEIDTDIVEPEQLEHCLDLELAAVREDMVTLYAVYRAGKEEATELAKADLSTMP